MTTNKNDTVAANETWPDVTPQDRMKAMLQKAYEYLKEGKRKFAPSTTNSDVDEWLKEYETFAESQK